MTTNPPSQEGLFVLFCFVLFCLLVGCWLFVCLFVVRPAVSFEQPAPFGLFDPLCRERVRLLKKNFTMKMLEICLRYAARLHVGSMNLKAFS